jgi:hypothetical protein
MYFTSFLQKRSPPPEGGGRARERVKWGVFCVVETLVIRMISPSP